MICYAIRNKKTKKFVYGFDYRYGMRTPHMRYIHEDIEDSRCPKLFSQWDIELFSQWGIVENTPELRKIPKCCELVKVEIKEVK